MNDIDEASSGPIITDEEREIAQSALTEFNKGNYVLCLQQLSRLDNRNQDYKVYHNKIVAEFYKSDLKKTDTFKRNLNQVFSKARIRPEVIDDVEQCVCQYNYAVLLYHQQQYAAALRIVNRLFSFVEPMDESLAHRVCLLLIELHIVTNQPEKGLSLIEYIENQFINPDLPVLLTGDKEIKILKKKTDVTIEIFKSKLLFYRARCHLTTHALKLAKQDIEHIISSKGRTSSSICLNAHLEYLRGNHHKSIKILQSFPPNELEFRDCGEISSVIFYNNVGVIHHALGKFNLASYYLQTAFKEYEKNTSMLPKIDASDPLTGRPLYTLGDLKKHEIFFNLGITLLYAGRPTDAFDCLVVAVQRYYKNPRLWLRLAECCIQAHKMTNEVDFNAKRQGEILQKQIGDGPHRKIILTTNLSNDKKYSVESQSSAIPVPTLEFASLCLRNALMLLTMDVTSPTSVTSPNGTPSFLKSNVSISSKTTTKEYSSLHISVLIANAYVSLCLGDYIMTLEYSNMLLEQSNLHGAHKLLAHLYAAEALVLTNKISEALELLNPENIQDINITENSNESGEFCVTTKPPTNWFPKTLESAQSVLRYNLAVALAIRGDYDKAAETLKVVWLSKNPVPIHVVMLVLYIELQLGRLDASRSFIKQHCPQYK